jgi:hypothetical protein
MSAAKTYKLTELGNAERFADLNRHQVAYVSPWKKWIVYDGKRKSKFLIRFSQIHDKEWGKARKREAKCLR